MPQSFFTRDLEATMEKLLWTTLAIEPLAPTNARMILYQNQITPSENTTLAQLTECNFDGYSNVTLGTFTAPYINLGGDTVIRPVTIPSFSCTGTVVSNQVWGMGIVRIDTTVLQIIEQFDTAITPTAGQSFQLTPEIKVEGTVDSCLC